MIINPLHEVEPDSSPALHGELPKIFHEYFVALINNQTVLHNMLNRIYTCQYATLINI